ncbi:hypothetical protein NH286_08685 [Anaerococcus sp. NML200574]|uniref:hypothetical protein n=1 Tax=Anaerococcus sp. NML200574 TaxID=2954486 RepID=UPI000D0B2931|nr:hypothetical protein [Anaerococcus sp. NML200574]MCW6679231.1 hypothetical protein [Anaerococcus sp. NML200574]
MARLRFLGIGMSKSVMIRITFTKCSVYLELLAEGKLLIMLPALGAAWGCNGEGFKGDINAP